MIENLNLTDYPKSSTYSNMTFFTSNGATLDEKWTNQLYKIVENILEESALASEDNGSLKDYFNSQ